MDFVSELVRKRGKENLHKFIQFIVGIFKRYILHICMYACTYICIYIFILWPAMCVSHNGCSNGLVFVSCIIFSSSYDEAPVEYKPYRQKDGALLAIGALCDKLKQTEPYKSQLEPMLVQHVFPEFNSPVGHLRAKVCWSKISFLLIYYYQIWQLIGFDVVVCFDSLKLYCWPLFFSDSDFRTVASVASQLYCTSKF